MGARIDSCLLYGSSIRRVRSIQSECAAMTGSMQIVGGLQLLSLPLKRYTKTMDRELGKIIREAAREWLRAVIKAVPSRGGFPVLTGMAKSTLKPLSRFLRVAIGSTSPQPGFKSRESDGEKLSRFKITDDKSNPGSFVYEFEWSNEVLHYYLNEYYEISTVSSSPWFTEAQGESAFLQYVEQALNDRMGSVVSKFEVVYLSEEPNG